MKILLFSYNASFVQTSLGIRCIKDALLDLPVEVEISESTEKEPYDRVLANLVSKKADIYGFSAYIWNITASLRLAEDLKSLLPNSKIVFGGPEVSFCDDNFFALHPFVDTVIQGEGESAWQELCTEYKYGIVKGEKFRNFENTGIHYSSDDALKSSIVYYESSRGCPFHCAYCLSASDNSLRMKTVEKTLEDLMSFEALDGIKIIKFVDRTFNADRKRANSIWRALLSSDFTKNYHFEVCAFLIDEEALDILSKFPKGKIRLEIGVQSTNPETLRAVNRSEEVDKVIDVIKRLHALHNLTIHTDLIVGLPHESLSIFKDSFNSLYGLCNMLQVGFLKLLKGSPLESIKDRYGYVFSSHPPYTVLKNDSLSESELFTLKNFEKCFDRYSSAGFARSLAILSQRINPFDLFLSLSEFIEENSGDITKLSQNRAYIMLYDFAREKNLLDSSLIIALRLDFLLAENGRMPSPLYCDEYQSPSLKSSFARANPEFFFPAITIYSFPEDGDNLYFIDRKNHLLKICSTEGLSL